MKKKQKQIEGYVRNKDIYWAMGFYAFILITVLIASTYQQNIEYSEGYTKGFFDAELSTKICEIEKDKLMALSTWAGEVCSEELENCINSKTLGNASSLIQKLLAIR